MLLCLQHLVTLADVLPVDRTRSDHVCTEPSSVGRGTGSVHRGSKGVTLLSASQTRQPWSQAVAASTLVLLAA